MKEEQLKIAKELVKNKINGCLILSIILVILIGIFGTDSLSSMLCFGSALSLVILLVIMKFTKKW